MRRSTVRSLVEEKVGDDLATFFRKLKRSPEWRTKLSTEKAIDATIKTIGLLERLHQAGFVQGDIHEGSIAFRDNGEVVLFHPRDGDSKVFTGV